jgi:LacI family transcriptional regulator
MEVFDVEGYLTFLSLHLREAGREKKDLLSAIERGDEGVLCCPLPGADQVYKMLVDRNIPLVFLDDTLTEMPEASYVSWEVAGASQVVMEYLIKTGHKKIGLIGAIFNSWSTKTRCETFRKVLAQAGLPVNDAWIGLQVAGSSPDSTIEKMFAPGQDRPDALFAIDDALALQAIDKLVRMGIRVPDDVAVAGMGDLQGASHSCIGLTTVREPVEEIGHNAAEVILQLIKGPKQGPIQKLIKGTELQIRKTA